MVMYMCWLYVIDACGQTFTAIVVCPVDHTASAIETHSHTRITHTHMHAYM